MSDLWFVLADRGRLGPFYFAELSSTVATYPDPEEVLVKLEREKFWRRAGDVPGLVKRSESTVGDLDPETIIPERGGFDPPSPHLSTPLPASQRWAKSGAIIGFVVGALSVLGEISDGKFHAENVAYLLGLMVGSAFVGAIIAFIVGCVADWMSRPQKAGGNDAAAIPKIRPAWRWNFVLSHWRGRLPLWVSYWIINFITNIGIFVLAAIIATAFEPKSGYDPVWAFASITTIWLCIVGLLVWQIVGLWRSANNHITRREAIGKSAPWAGLAKVAAIFMAIKLGATFLQAALPQLAEGVSIAFLGDPEIPAYSFRLMRNGTEVEIAGGFKYGLTDELKKLLKASRQIRVVHLDSTGGRIGEAKKLYEVIEQNKLITYVASQCASACTLAFAAGRERYIAANAVLGFHAPSFPGMDKQEMAETALEQRNLFLRSGFSASFVDRALQTPASDLWTPTVAELYAGRAITHVSDGTEFALSGLGEMTKAGMGDMLAKVLPSLEALRDFFPDKFQSVIDTFYANYINGETQAQSIAEVRQEMLSIMASLRINSDDSVLKDMARWYADVYMALSRKNNISCYTFASGQSGYENDLPSELVTRETELSIRVIRTARQRAPSDTTKTSDAWNKLRTFLRVYKFSDADLALIGSTNEIPASRYHDYCLASISFFSAIAALPQSDAAIIMRKVLVAREN